MRVFYTGCGMKASRYQKRYLRKLKQMLTPQQNRELIALNKATAQWHRDMFPNQKPRFRIGHDVNHVYARHKNLPGYRAFEGVTPMHERHVSGLERAYELGSAARNPLHADALASMRTDPIYNARDALHRLAVSRQHPALYHGKVPSRKKDKLGHMRFRGKDAYFMWR